MQKLSSEKMVEGLDCKITTDTNLCESGGKNF